MIDDRASSIGPDPGYYCIFYTYVSLLPVMRTNGLPQPTQLFLFTDILLMPSSSNNFLR